MDDSNHSNIEKQKIFYSRTYRYLNGNRLGSLLYLLLLVLPCLVLLLIFYGDLSIFISNLAGWVLERAGLDTQISYATVDFIPFLNKIKIVVLPTTVPDFSFVFVNLLVSFLLLYLCLHGKGRNRPIGIYLGIVLFIHIMNCAFFLFAAEKFPYSAKDYSGLYMEQQIGIWIAFLVIMGLITGILGYKGLFIRIFTFFSVLLYSFLFGILRYILALYVVYRFSVLYIALFFFALGPFFDFLYLVMIYGFYVNKMISIYDGEKGMGEWKWS